MTEQLGSGNAKGLVDYLDSLVSKGRTRSGVVVPLKTALVKVLEKTEGEDWEDVDVIKLDVVDAISRFKNFTLGNYTDASYRAYELRMKRAIKWYESFLQNPGWYPKESIRTPKILSGNGKPDSQQSVTESTNVQTSVNIKYTDIPKLSQNTVSLALEAPKIDVIAYPFPLSNGETARIYMPKGISKSDVSRLSGFLEALVIEDSKE